MEKPNNNPVNKHRNTSAQECSISAVERRGSLELLVEATPKSVKLCFSKELPKTLTNQLSEIGFKQTFNHPLKWYAPKHPAFVNYANALAKAIRKGEDALRVLMHPSFTPSEEHINLKKFSYITLYYKKGGSKKQDHYIIFDSYKTVATHIATRFGKTTHNSNFIGVNVQPRNYLQKARTLLKQGKVISSITSPEPRLTKTQAPVIPKGDTTDKTPPVEAGLIGSNFLILFWVLLHPLTGKNGLKWINIWSFF